MIRLQDYHQAINVPVYWLAVSHVARETGPLGRQAPWPSHSTDTDREPTALTASHRC